jgi:hypothetical protein
MLYSVKFGIFLRRQLIDAQELNLVRIKIRDKCSWRSKMYHVRYPAANNAVGFVH